MITKQELIRGTRQELEEYFNEFVLDIPHADVNFTKDVTPEKTHWLIGETASEQLDELMTEQNNIAAKESKMYVGPLFFMSRDIKTSENEEKIEEVVLKLESFWVQIVEEAKDEDKA